MSWFVYLQQLLMLSKGRVQESGQPRRDVGYDEGRAGGKDDRQRF